MMDLIEQASWYRGLGGRWDKSVVHNSPSPKLQYPWDSVQLSKQERKGKSYEEMQALRKTKYETREE